ncbi:hypothetical protein DUI87_14479 [Hirundo rustica rustica]|uniref:Uncharacterized protein n=1 Tax=Hirundo rustica rustica TaxID=333673 RepID=A0A3M0K582_HIRRU|nr:hypothetical protein DUI87_14479 [Hirundo rustica rustica]
MLAAGIAGDKNDEVIRVFNSTGSWAARWARGKINIYTTSLEDSEHVIPRWKKNWDAKSFWTECVILPKPGFAEKRGIGG